MSLARSCCSHYRRNTRQNFCQTLQSTSRTQRTCTSCFDELSLQRSLYQLSHPSIRGYSNICKVNHSRLLVIMVMITCISGMNSCCTNSMADPSPLAILMLVSWSASLWFNYYYQFLCFLFMFLTLRIAGDLSFYFGCSFWGNLFWLPVLLLHELLDFFPVLFQLLLKHFFFIG